MGFAKKIGKLLSMSLSHYEGVVHQNLSVLSVAAITCEYLIEAIGIALGMEILAWFKKHLQGRFAPLQIG